MGFRFNGRHSDEFGLCFRTSSIPYIAPKRQTTVEVQGRDGQYVFEGDYDNIQISLDCSIAGATIIERRKKARAIASWLATTGTLVFDYERDVAYNVIKATNDISAKMEGREYRDDFSITFECEPTQQQTFYNDNLTWEDMDIAWDYANIPWDGYERKFTVTAGETISVENVGTYKALPVIILTGVATYVDIGNVTFLDLNGTVYIDCKNQVVYSQNGSTKTNRINDFYGNFIELAPGSNEFLIDGEFSELTIEFDYKNTYL